MTGSSRGWCPGEVAIEEAGKTMWGNLGLILRATGGLASFVIHSLVNPFNTHFCKIYKVPGSMLSSMDTTKIMRQSTEGRRKHKE